MQKGKAALLMQRAFYGSLADQLLSWQRDDSLPFVAATDGARVLYNETRLADWSVADCAFVAAHELGHVIFEHIPQALHYLRRKLGPDGKPFDRDKWNVATDLRINTLLAADGFKVPKEALMPENTGIAVNDADTAISIYCRITAPQMKKRSGGFDEHQIGKPGMQPLPSKAEIQQAVARALAEARSQGTEPKFAQRLVDGLVKPKQSLRDILIQELRAHGRPDDYSMRRFNRRRLAHTPQLLLPGMVSSSAGVVVIGIDTSGSISPAELRFFASLLRDVLTECGFDALHAVALDAAIQHAQQLQSVGDLDSFVANVRGGGGTNMPVLFDWIAQQGIAPNQVVILTDGCTPFGERQAYPVFWAVTTDCQAPHGTTARLNVE